jgi:tetratricopeptide (TPR) repeat protein
MDADLPLLEQAFARYQGGDLAAVERLLARLPDHPSALHLLGLVRVRQGRAHEAADLLARSVAVRPDETQAQFNYGRVLAALGRHAEAATAFKVVLADDAGHAGALLALARSQQALGDLDAAIKAYEFFLQKEPRHVPASLALGLALIGAGRCAESTKLLAAAVWETQDRALLADLHLALASARRGLRDYGAALAHIEQAMALNPAREDLRLERAGLLEAAHCFEDAKAIYKQALVEAPAEAGLHRKYNDLLYRLGEADVFLRSYDQAPRTKELLLDKAQVLLSADRWDEARLSFEAVLSRYGADKAATLGVGLSLLKANKISESISVLEDAARIYPDGADINCNLSAALARAGDAPKAVMAARTAVGLAPLNQTSLAMLGTCLRLAGDGADEHLNGYEEFVRVFDLEPPHGFAGMADFNSTLMAELDGMHPKTGAYLRQSLRGGTQTTDNLFDSGFSLLDQLRVRIEEAVTRYVLDLREDGQHPLLSRRRNGFRFSGSWSSRLHDSGFHINHLHPGGWISSCYYVEVPGAVADPTQKQGWIQFGQPSFDVGLQPRRAIQPMPGRLILFPSYMWHGTVPFHDERARTTIAFDVVPV